MKNKIISIITNISLLLCICSVMTSSAQASDLQANDFQEMTPTEIANIFKNSIMPRSVLPIRSLQLGRSNGRLVVYYTNIASQTCSEIGIHNLKLQKQNQYGVWLTIRTTQPVEYNADSCIGGYYYLAPEPGTSYRLLGEHYCIINGKENVYANTTDPFVF